jgi:hypothetical protein
MPPKAFRVPTRWFRMKPTLLILALTSSLFAAERPEVTVPRQTSGDTAVQPTWEESLTITVGTKDTDIVGSDQRAIQAAVDHVARLCRGAVGITKNALEKLKR